MGYFILPGLLMALVMLVLVTVQARRLGFPVEAPVPVRELPGITQRAFPALLMPAVLPGGIYSGAMTPTEAARPRGLVFHQTNAEYQPIDGIHQAIDVQGAAIISNPADLSFPSVPLMDALKMFPGVVIDLHISNIHRREPVYHTSLISKVATTVIAGLGPLGYRAAVVAACRMTA